MQRSGFEGHSGLIFVLNNRGDAWSGTGVETQWKNTTFVPAAWRGRNDDGIPLEQQTNENGHGEFYAPPRGYVVYVPQG
jgi:alpha-amylase